MLSVHFTELASAMFSITVLASMLTQPDAAFAASESAVLAAAALCLAPTIPMLPQPNATSAASVLGSESTKPNATSVTDGTKGTALTAALVIVLSASLGLLDVTVSATVGSVTTSDIAGLVGSTTVFQVDHGHCCFRVTHSVALLEGGAQAMTSQECQQRLETLLFEAGSLCGVIATTNCGIQDDYFYLLLLHVFISCQWDLSAAFQLLKS